MKDSTQQSESNAFRLLDLPREIYLSILELVLIHPGPICLHPHGQLIDNTLETKASNPTTSPNTTTLTNQTQLKRLILPPAITRTSRLLRQDGLRLFYERNVFHGLNWTNPRPNEWLSLIPAEIRKQARGSFFLSSLWSKEEIAVFLVSRAMGFDGKAFELVETGVRGGKRKLAVCGQVAEGRVFEVRFL